MRVGGNGHYFRLTARPHARCCWVFVSAEYATHDWTRLERRVALDRAVRERREYVLPGRFDDTPLPGLLSGMAAVNLRRHTPGQFADLVVAKLAYLGISPAPPQDVDGRAPASGGPAESPADTIRPAAPPRPAVRLMDDAVRAAHLITDQGRRARVLASIAKVLAASDPDQAAWLIADAERAAQSITDESVRASALVRIAKIELTAGKPSGPVTQSLRVAPQTH
jgi:hypothetical protein